MTAPAYAQLEDDTLGTLEFGDNTGIYVATLDLGFPTIRRVTQPRPDANGELDTTKHHGAKAVTITGTVVATLTETRQEILDRLRAYMRPDLRPYLVFQLEPDGPIRRVRLSSDSHAAPIVRPNSSAFAASWRGPDGVNEADDETEITIVATENVEAGRTYDLEFDRVYPPSAVIGAVIVTNDGNIDTYPRIRLYGPVTGPKIENQTTGQTLELPDLVIVAGDYVELDTLTRTVLYLSDPDQSRYSYMDFDVSDWWALKPGDNNIRYYPDTSALGAAAVITFRSAWL